MVIYVSSRIEKSGKGTKESPFGTIQEAANLACPGDEVIICPGVYRENINPLIGGTVTKPIKYSAMKAGTVIVTGAERIVGWTRYSGEVWRVSVSNEMFGKYNPYTTRISGDWLFTTEVLHTGEVYLNGTSMYETQSLEQVLNPEIWKYSYEPEKSLYKWYTQQLGNETVIYANFMGVDPNLENVEINVRRNCFFPSKEGVNYITISGIVFKQAATQWAPPTAFQDGMVGANWSKGWIIEDCEFSNSKCCAISIGKYLQPDNENKWTRFYLKDGTQTERDAICQAVNEGWSKETVGSHIIRRCHIHDCGQCGIVGHLGGVFSKIEDNHIHHINCKQELIGAENAGIKMHAAIDVVICHNYIHHCSRGVWLDWQAQGTRVTRNIFHDNMPTDETVEIEKNLGLGEDIFIEVSHGPTLIDNNIMLSDCGARISSQGVAFVHNLITGSFTYVSNGDDNGGVRFPTPRYTPYHCRHSTSIAGFMTILHGDMRFYNNIFVQKPIRSNIDRFIHSYDYAVPHRYNMECGTFIYDDYPTEKEYFSGFRSWTPDDLENNDRYYDHLPVYMGGNIYLNGARAYGKEENNCIISDFEPVIDIVKIKNGIELRTNISDVIADFKVPVLSSADLGIAFEPEQGFEDMNGNDIIFDVDILNNKRTEPAIAGPFAEVKKVYNIK